MLLSHFRTFSRAYYAALSGTDLDISRPYIAVKLWLLLARQSARPNEDDFNSSGEYIDLENTSVMMIWNELWPPFEAVVCALEQHGATSSLMVRSEPMYYDAPAKAIWWQQLLTSSSVADLFLFVHQSRTIVSLERSSQVELLNRLRKVSRADSKVSMQLSLAESIPHVSAL